MEDYESLEEALADWFNLGHVVASRFFMGAFYVAHRHSDSTDVEAAVILTKDDSDGTRMFKHIPEALGPFACWCPLSILTLLSETHAESAQAWRQRCLVWNETVVEAFVRADIEAADAIAVKLNETPFRFNP